MGKTEQSKISFHDKWDKNRDLAFEETLREGSDIFNWILERNGWKNPEDLRRFLGRKKRVLDAGCGNGRVTALLRTYAPIETTEIVAIDLVAAEVARENLSGLNNVSVHAGDLLGDLSTLGTFDFIYCQEVLHHTGNPEAGFKNLCNLLEPDGEIAIYVYREKAPIREYADDFIRAKISDLPYEEAMAHCRQITELGRVLSDLDMEVDIPKVDLLGIEAGQYDLQRFLYHFFLKCFWNANLDSEANAVINYDWYHPQNCTRHNLAEVRNWFRASGLIVVHEHVDHYGITVRGQSSTA